MGINLDKMRAKLAKLKSRGSRNNFWKPQTGEQTIRIVPTADGDPFREFWFHYNLGSNGGFLSPKRNFGEDDPLDAFVRSLFDSGTDEDLEMAKNLVAKQRFFVPVVVRGEEDQGVRIWGFGKRAYERLLELTLNPDYDDITDVDEGTDLVIKYGKVGNDKYPSTKIEPRRRDSPLASDPAQADTWLSSIPDMDTLFTRKTPQEVGAMLDEWLAAEVDASADDRPEVNKYSPQSTDEVKAAFDTLLQQSA